MTKRLAHALEDHCALLRQCRRCELGGGVRPIASSARAPRVMLVGQAPGKVESDGGTPFAGRAGRTLFRWLQRVGIDEPAARERIHIAAITRCYPGPSPSGRGDRVPARAEQANCSSWLDDELRIIRPVLVIPVGRLAIIRFLPSEPLDALIGREHRIDHLGGSSIAVPLPHPSGASSWIHQRGHTELLEAALKIVAAHLLRLGVVQPSGSRSVA